MIKYKYVLIVRLKIILKEVLEMNILFYLAFILAVMILSYFIVDKYLDIKNIKTKRIIRNIVIILVILLIIALVVSLIYFFKLFANIGPI